MFRQVNDAARSLSPCVSVLVRVRVATIACLWFAVACGWYAQARWPLLCALALSCVPYAWLLCEAKVPERLTSVPALLGCVACAALPFLLSDALLSSDVYRHLFEGRVVRAGENPFAHAPLSQNLVSLRDANWQHINHKEVATIYPVLSQAVFALLSLANTIYAFKALGFALHLLSTVLLLRWRSARAAWLFGLNPLMLCEGVLSGHHDLGIGLLLLAAVVFFQTQPPTRASERKAWLAVVLAGGFKVVGVLVALVRARQQPLAAASALLVIALLLAPNVLCSGERVSGSTQFAHRWQSQTGAFVVLRSGTDLALKFVGVRQHTRFKADPNLPELLDPTATFSDVYQGALRREDLGALVARLLALVFVVVFAVWSGRRFALERALLLTVWFALLLSPQFHPWYWMWFVPLACHPGRSAAIIATPVVLACHASIDAWTMTRAAGPPEGWIHVMLWLLWAVEWRFGE